MLTRKEPEFIMTEAKDPALERFASAVSEGLSATEKRLPSRYFYDARGDRIFQAIMRSPEYYLTDCEFEIFESQADAITRAMAGDDHTEPFEMVELGAGDGLKTRLLLQAAMAGGLELTYVPIDISPDVLGQLRDTLADELPRLRVHSQTGEYFDALDRLSDDGPRRVYLFLGGNIGNFPPDAAKHFLRGLRRRMREQDLLFIGLDLQKDPRTILSAYNDSAGHTRDFNLNLLRRINHELGGDFDLDCFAHYPSYDPQTGAAKSFLVSEIDQVVNVARLDRSFRFHAGEVIFMEISQKYDDELINELALTAGFEVVGEYRDRRGYFTDQFWRPLP